MINLGLIKCPYCQSHISKFSKKCPKCNEWLNEEEINTIAEKDKKDDTAWNIGCIVFFLCFIASTIIFFLFVTSKYFTFNYLLVLMVILLGVTIYLTKSAVENITK